MGYSQINTVLMMSYYNIAITQVRKKRFAVCNIKEEEGCKEASPFKCIRVSTLSVQAVFDNLFKYTKDGKAEISHLYETICHHYLRNLKPRQDPLDGCLLERVCIYKRRASFIPHESILFTLRSKYDGGKEFQLLVERTVNILSAVGLSSKNPSSAKNANDTARMVEIVAGTDMLSHKSYGESIWTLVMPPADTGFTINLIQILTLLRALRGTNRSQEYHAFDRNCFWLVRMARLTIIRLAQRAGVQVTPETTKQAEGRLGTCGCVRLDGSKSHDLGEVLVDQVINEFEVDYQDFEQSYYGGLMSSVSSYLSALGHGLLTHI